MAALPKQVEQDLRDLEEYERQLKAPTSGETPPVGTPPVEKAQAEPPLAPAPVEKTAAPAPEVPLAPVKDDWEHKYQTLLGKYNAEVPRMFQQNKELGDQLRGMQQQLDTLKQAPAAAPAPAAAVESLVTDKDVTEYGAELIDVQRRVAREELRGVVAPLQDELKKRDKEVADLKALLTKTGGDVAAVTFEQKLNQVVPDFPAINTDPKWIAFLDEVDPFTREPRRAFAEFAYNNGDVARIKQVVDFYKQTAGVTTPAADVRQQRQTELERQITPTRTTATTSVTPTANDRVYTEAEVTAGFNRVRQLNISGKYDEASKLEAELSEAYMTGRVRG